MRITKLGHSCVRVENEGAALVIDPGCFSATDAVNGADAILITHEHIDHVVPEWLKNAAAAGQRLRIWTNQNTADLLADVDAEVHVIRQGDRLDVAGFDVHVYGEQHALIHRDFPPAANTGYLVDGAFFHPGDSVTVPGEPVPVLLTPLGGPWMKLAEIVDYVREVAPAKALTIHDAVLSEAGQAAHLRMLTALAGEGTDREIVAWHDGDSIELN